MRCVGGGFLVIAAFVWVGAAAPPYRCPRACIDVRARLESPSGNLVLPVPTGHRVEPESVRFNGHPLAGPFAGLMQSVWGECVSMRGISIR